MFYTSYAEDVTDSSIGKMFWFPCMGKLLQPLNLIVLSSTAEGCRECTVELVHRVSDFLVSRDCFALNNNIFKLRREEVLFGARRKVLFAFSLASFCLPFLQHLPEIDFPPQYFEVYNLHQRVPDALGSCLYLHRPSTLRSDQVRFVPYSAKPV